LSDPFYRLFHGWRNPTPSGSLGRKGSDYSTYDCTDWTCDAADGGTSHGTGRVFGNRWYLDIILLLFFCV
jgi:hypothetical protein